MKKIIAIILATCMFASFGIIANAATAPESEIMPLWDNISSLINAFSFSGSMGTVDCEIYGDAGTTVTANVKVYRQTSTGAWSLVGYDSGSSDTRSLFLTAHFNAVSGTYYKSVLTATVYKNGVGETATRTSYKTCP